MGSNIPSWLPTAIFVPLVGLAVYRRVRRAFDRQPLTVSRMVIRATPISLIAAFVASSIRTALGAEAAVVGAALGATLAAFGLARTRYDADSKGNFYTPNRWIGAIVSALFMGRIATRLASYYGIGGGTATPAASPFAALQSSPLTLAIFFWMAAYYSVYYGGLALKARSLRKAKALPGVT